MPTTTLATPTPADVHQTLARRILADGYDVVFDYERSHGAWMHDSRAGRDYLDFCSFYASNPVGFNHPRMHDPGFLTLLHRVAQLKPALSDLYTVEYAWFVDVFGRIAMPAHLKHAFFIEGGTLGVENALKVAFDWKVRRNRAKGVAGTKGQKVIHFRHAFHGRSGYALSLTNTDPRKTDLFPKFDWPRVDSPAVRFPRTAEGDTLTLAEEERAKDQIERAFADNPDDIAALIVEPIQAEGGDRHFRPEFLQALERACRAHECFFVLDEVQTGVGITGRMWAHEHFGLRPDAVAFGKKMQVCGCLAGPRVDEEPENVFKVSSRISSTWGGGLTDMVRAARYLEIIEQENLLENARVVGERLLAGLRGIEAERGGLVSGSRGLGLMIAFDLPDAARRDLALDRMLACGLLLLGCGERSVRFRPPLNLTAAEADDALTMVREGLKEL